MFPVSESFALNWDISVVLTNKYPLPPLWCRVKQNFIHAFVKLIECWVSAVNVWFYTCVGPLPRTKMSFPLLSMCTDELILIPKIITFLNMPSSDKEWYPRVLNSIP